MRWRSRPNVPLSSILCLPSACAQEWITPRWANCFGDLRILREVVLLDVFAGVEVVEDAEELVEAVRGRQVLVAVAEVVLAELPGA